MKKLSYLIVLTLILGLVLAGCSLLSNVGQVPTTGQSGVSGIINSKGTGIYSDQILSDWQSGNFSEVWDLTQCGLTLSYTINMSNIATPGWVLTEIGLREVGAPNLDPNDKGGFLLSRYASSASGNIANLNDYHVLMKHGWSKEYYDREGAFPGVGMSDIIPGTYINYAFWFDRDGVDPDQATYWNYKDGNTYNTEGVYNVVIQYLALGGGGEGVMYATINGEQQGFYTQGYSSADPPEMMPVGRTFTGDMTKMQVFYGRGGGGGTVTISDITVDGCLLTIVINGCDTGVADTLFNDKLISVLIQEIYCDAKNHGQFVRGVALLTNDLMKAGIITGEEKGKIQSCAAQANQLPKEDGMVLWLDAGMGITAASGISKWEDQSGSGNHAVQETTSFQPTYIPDGLNGNPVVRFSGGEKYLRHSPILTDSYTAFYVLKLSESAGNLVYYYHAGNVHTGDLGFFAETKNKEEGWGSAGNVDTLVTVRM